jgi:hypothetical protein
LGVPVLVLQEADAGDLEALVELVVAMSEVGALCCNRAKISLWHATRIESSISLALRRLLVALSEVGSCVATALRVACSQDL